MPSMLWGREFNSIEKKVLFYLLIIIIIIKMLSQCPYSTTHCMARKGRSTPRTRVELAGELSQPLEGHLLFPF